MGTKYNFGMAKIQFSSLSLLAISLAGVAARQVTYQAPNVWNDCWVGCGGRGGRCWTGACGQNGYCCTGIPGNRHNGDCPAGGVQHLQWNGGGVIGSGAATCVQEIVITTTRRTTTTTKKPTQAPIVEPTNGFFMKYWSNWQFLNFDIKAFKVASIEACMQQCQNNKQCKAIAFFNEGFMSFLTPKAVADDKMNCILKSGTGAGPMDNLAATGVSAGVIGTFTPPKMPPGEPKIWGKQLASPTAASECAGPTCSPDPDTCDASTPTKFCNWGGMAFGFTENLVNQAAASSQEKCWAACLNFKGCKAASYDTKNRWASNCFMYSKVSSGQVTTFDGFTSGWFCGSGPDPLPEDPSDDCWTPPKFPPPPGQTTTPEPVTTTEATTTTKAPPPTCVGGAMGFCRVFGDPHFRTTDGKSYDNHSTGQFTMAAYDGTRAPKFSVKIYLTRRWPCKGLSMVERFWVRFASEDGCGEYEVEGWLANPAMCGNDRWTRQQNRITTKVTFIDYKTGRRGAAQTGEWRVGRSSVCRTHTGMHMHTWFGLSFSYGNWDWDAKLNIPGCYRRLLVIPGVCSNFDGWSGNDLGWPPRGRRALLDFDSEKIQLSEPTALARQRREEPTCDSRANIESRCALMSKADSFSQCQAKFPTDGEFGFEANCVFDICTEESLGFGGDSDACEPIRSYAQMCMSNMPNELSKGDKICNWVKETNCAPECPANSTYQPCADMCRDVRTCGTRSPVPKDCPDVKLESMCVCNEGFYLLNEECVPESECGCVTDEQAVVEEGFKATTCWDSCTCTNGAYTCESHPEGTIIEGCSDDPSQEYPITGPVDGIDDDRFVAEEDAVAEEDDAEEEEEEEEKDPVEELVEMTDAFKAKMKEEFKDSKFARLVYNPVIKVRNRMKNVYHRFKCPILKERALMRYGGPCPDLIKTLNDVIDWNLEHVAECDDPRGVMTKRAKNYNKQLQKAKKRMEDKCTNKFALANKD